MLRNYYAPTDFPSTDVDPSIEVEDKLSIIASSPVNITPVTVYDGGYFDSAYYLTLPFIDCAEFFLHSGVRNSYVFSKYINIGDKQLYGKGIGSRLLRSAMRYAVETNPEVETFSTGHARLGVVNTAVNVFGKENVSVQKFGDRFGWQSDRNLDEVLDVYPPEIGKKYIVKGIEAKIDRDLAKTWELPVPEPN